MSELKNLEDLFHHQLRDIYNAEQQLIKAMPEFQNEAVNPELKDALAKHLEETKSQKERLDQVADELGIDLEGETCEAMKGLIEEGKDFVSEDASDHVRDAGIIADAQRIEHYEISAYGTVRHFSKALGHDNVTDILQEILDEENNADEILNEIAIGNINLKAKA